MSDETIAGANHYAGDAPWTHGGVVESRLVITGGHDGEETVYIPPDAPVMPRSFPLFMSEQDLRRFVREEVHKALDDLAKEIRTRGNFRPITSRTAAPTERRIE